jgi:ribosomal protein S18 acetylase RimI-like enzyme
MVKIRQANKDDISKISSIATKTFIDAFGHSYSPEELEEKIDQTRSVSYYNQAIAKYTIFVAEENNQMIGFIQFGEVTFKTNGISEEDQELQRVYVLSDHQGKGVGKALIDAALSHPRLKKSRNIYLNVWQDNLGAQKLYRSYGFKETGEVVDGDIIMIKRNDRQ